MSLATRMACAAVARVTLSGSAATSSDLPSASRRLAANFSAAAFCRSSLSDRALSLAVAASLRFFAVSNARCASRSRSALASAAETSTAAGYGAGATLDVLADTRSTLLFADTSTLEAMRGVEEPAALALRGGVIKVSSGADFLTNVVDVPVEGGSGGDASLPLELSGVPFVAMGRHAFWVGSATRKHQVSSTSSVI